MNNTQTEEKVYTWGPFLFETRIDKNFSDELLKRGEKATVRYNKHLAGLIENEYKYSDEDKEWCVGRMLPYMKRYLELGKPWYREKLQHKVIDIQLQGLWINYMKNGEYNPDHTHDDDVSFVIYLKIPKPLQKEAEKHKDPNHLFYNNPVVPGGITFSYGEYISGFLSKNFIFPKERDLLIFPARLRHSVAPFKSRCERISVSGNFKIIQK